MMDKNYILHKYLNGEATPEEIEILRQDPEYASYLDIALATEEMDTPFFKKEANFDALSDKLTPNAKVKSLHVRKTFIRIAAMVALLLGAYYFFIPNKTTITTSIAQKETFSLPDASEVILNAQSEIVYSEKSWEKNRNLRLNGEAYFKVSKGKKFSVITPQGTVSVLGTQFNVFARDSIFIIKCFEGMVRVSYNDKEVNVPFGNVLEVINAEMIAKRSLEQSAPNWILNESRFRDASLRTVLAELERQYPIKVIAPKMGNKNFTGAFTHGDLSVALRSICDPLKLDFTIDGDQVHLHAKEGQ